MRYVVRVPVYTTSVNAVADCMKTDLVLTPKHAAQLWLQCLHVHRSTRHTANAMQYCSLYTPCAHLQCTASMLTLLTSPLPLLLPQSLL
jgi:hypothetical protein